MCEWVSEWGRGSSLSVPAISMAPLNAALTYSSPSIAPSRHARGAVNVSFYSNADAKNFILKCWWSYRVEWILRNPMSWTLVFHEKVDILRTGHEAIWPCSVWSLLTVCCDFCVQGNCCITSSAKRILYHYPKRWFCSNSLIMLFELLKWLYTSMCFGCFLMILLILDFCAGSM